MKLSTCRETRYISTNHCDEDSVYLCKETLKDSMCNKLYNVVGVLIASMLIQINILRFDVI